MNSFKDYFSENTVASDIAGYSGKMNTHSKKPLQKKLLLDCDKILGNIQEASEEEIQECKEQSKNKSKNLKESRPTRISNIFLELDKCKNFKLIDMHGTYSGFVGLVRFSDGNAYEISIKPAEKSNEFPDYTKGT